MVGVVVAMLALSAVVGIVRLLNGLHQAAQPVPETAVVEDSPAFVDDGYGFYTERFYEAAATREAAIATESSDEKGYAFYTERYYQAAEAREAAAGAEEKDYAFYTERYYEAAAAREAANPATR
jgi:hypothetical protein